MNKPDTQQLSSLQQPDKGDLLSELGQLQRTMWKINSEMLAIHDLLKKLP